MAPSSLSSFARTCIFCLSSLQLPTLLPQTQRAFRSTRSKRQIFLVVQLKQSYPTWGREGTYLRVTPGFMRNVLYPGKIARYVVGEELKTLLSSDTPIQRDRSFTDPFMVTEDDGLLKAWKATSSSTSSTKSSIPTISPRRRFELLQSLAQSKYTFHRRINPNATDSIPLELEQNQVTSKWPVGTPIFGSVSTGDIAQAIKDSIAHDEEASSITLGPSNIRIISGSSEDADSSRLKTLGTFEVEITLGKDLVLTREVEVMPETDVSRTEIGQREGTVESEMTV